MESRMERVFQCDCYPGKTYRSGATFRQHYQSRRHELFQQNKKKTDMHRRLQVTEIELVKKTRECEIWKQKYFDTLISQDEEFHDCL